jgi:ubiquinone/menaquinone biosynthesis C-methylase UbiE
LVVLDGHTGSQDKALEVAFFDRLAAAQEYDVFTPESNRLLIEAFSRLTGLRRGAKVVDLGCGSGTFTALLAAGGYDVSGVDLCPAQIKRARVLHPKIEFEVGDVENLPLETESFDGVMLSAIVHHLPDPSRCASEVFRVLRPGGRFMAFDPNRMNPFFYLYRDPSSPFYSQFGVTENERPILVWQVAEIFRHAGFIVESDFLSGISYRYVASGVMRHLLPIYNAIDRYAFSLNPIRRFSAFVLTNGLKESHSI